jgi:hypothetical protein
MDIYLEKLTLGNLVPALFWSYTGKKVRYFQLGRILLKASFLGAIWRGRVQKAEYHISKPVGLGYQIHGAALEAAESIYLRISSQEPATLNGVCRSFRSEKVRQYVKKHLAIESWPLCRDYLVLHHKVADGAPPVRLVAQDTPLNHLLASLLNEAHPSNGVQITGLSRVLGRMVQLPLSVMFATMLSQARLAVSLARRGLTGRRVPGNYKIAKELIWGVGVNTGRRNDDFMVDGQQIMPSDMLMYYRSSSAARMGNSDYLRESIQNCTARGYKCVNFDRVPVPLGWCIRQFFPRYIISPLLRSIAHALKSAVRPEAALIDQVLGRFVSQISGWDIVLQSHSPKLNISLDDPHPSHIADTIALNLHGALNSGFQWSDMTTYRSATLAYMSYDLYIAWGDLPANYWQGNWQIKQVRTTGYLWGHLYQESLSQRAALKRQLLGEEADDKLVLSLFDEKPDPDVYQSEEMLYDFYRIGVELLQRREDTVVIVKPKRFDGIPPVQPVLDLIAPYVESGRMVVWDRMQVDLWQVLAVSDAAVSMVMGTPHLEAACCGKPGFSYAPTKNEPSPIYSQGYGKVVFDTVEPLVEAVSKALDNPNENPWDSLPELLSTIDPYRDFRGVERMREFISSTTNNK